MLESLSAFFSAQLHLSYIRDLQLLAISTHITELSYSISDIQTRIFGVYKFIKGQTTPSPRVPCRNTGAPA